MRPEIFALIVPVALAVRYMKRRRPAVRSDTAEVLRGILSGERVEHTGDLAVNGFHLGTTPPPVPIYFAALTPSTLRLAGEVADGVIRNSKR